MTDLIRDTLMPALILLALFQVKHMFADYFLQTPRMLADRGRYFHFGRLQHAGTHALGSAIAFIIVGTPFSVLLPICLAEWVVHFHIDFFKGIWSQRAGDGPTDPSYWRAYGVDQAAHQMTYVAMLWAWANMGGI